MNKKYFDEFITKELRWARDQYKRYKTMRERGSHDEARDREMFTIQCIYLGILKELAEVLQMSKQYNIWDKCN